MLPLLQSPNYMNHTSQFCLAIEALNSDEQDVVINYMLAFASAYTFPSEDKKWLEDALEARQQECPESTFRKLFFLYLNRGKLPSSTYFKYPLSSDNIQKTLKQLKEQGTPVQAEVHRTGEKAKVGENRLRGYGAPV